MSRKIKYRQYWMSTLKDRHNCQMCGELVINAVFIKRSFNGVEGISWFCDLNLKTEKTNYNTIFQLYEKYLEKFTY